MNSDGSPFSDSTEHYDGTPASDEFRGKELPAPESINRYRITNLIARGGFGSVYRARDESLERDVAIKIPRRPGTDSADYSRWMAEARMVAMLDHANIVPVYDAGSTDEYQFYVVSKYIEGRDLRGYLEQQKPTIAQSVDWVIAIAQALQHAHSHGLVHRDVKPSNILIDKDDRPWLTDFGLALREEDIGREADKNKLVGTINYMSPEQARGEGHLVDGRADIFSLGVILYELLSGSRPFQGGSSRQLLRNIVYCDPRPLRQWDSRLPVELERICMKALAQRCADRYPNAADVAEDLKRFARRRRGSESSEPGSTDETLPLGPARRDVPVIPKGLRAFDEHDSEFFLKLVPGPRDGEGIPEILRRLKMPIESLAGKDTFRVAMLYGSSGSGKSSLVRAGLIPLLNQSVHVACVESNATQTESRLLQSLSRFVGEEKGSRGLVSVISQIRRGALGGGRKLLIVLDQFEQWLHGHKKMANTELVHALRQCDGTHVQCLVLIRDDFWMPATRFFRELEIPLVQDVNSTAVDRFELRHARFVLAEFGRAYDCLPKDASATTQDQNAFLDAVIDSIQQDGKVISVHLAVLAQMMKGRPWNLKTLSEFGGTEGVDINFLDATFTGSTAAPHHRALEAPARAVLEKLLPESGSDIKGQMHDVDLLRQSSGLSKRRFKQLLDVLDGELRLITPTVAVDEENDASPERCYQLTHDFLVPPMREWLTRSESQTFRGRAKLRLRELSQYWRANNDRRFLPNIFEYLRMVVLTNAATRNSDESKLMSAASRYHGARWAVASAVVFIMALGAAAIGRQISQSGKQQEAALMVKQLLAANIENVPRVIQAMQPLDDKTRPLLTQVVDSDDHSRTEKLHARLALVGADPEHVRPLVQAVSSSRVNEIEVICERLHPYRDEAQQALWSTMESDAVDEISWLHAALALAQLDPDDERWSQYGDRLARAVVSQSTPLVVEMAPALSNLSRYLLDTTESLFRTSPRDVVKANSAVILAQSLSASDPLLADLLVVASPAQFEILFDVAAANPDAIVPRLRNELSKRAEHKWQPSELDPDTPEADAATRELLVQAEGMLTRSLAICQKLPLDRFAAVAERLDDFGYRPESVRTYRNGDAVFVTAAWHRDGRSWALTRHPGADDAMEHVPQMRQRGLLPNDITPIAVDEKLQEIEYGVLWISMDDSVIDSRMYVGVKEEDHSSAWGPLNDENFVPKSNLKIRHPDGEDRYASVRRKMLLHPRYDDAWTDSDADYQSRILDGWHQVDVRLNPGGIFADDLTWAATWWNGGVFESRNPNLLDLKDHLKRCQQLAAEGFRPVSISVVDDDGLLAASVWHRPHLAEDDQDLIAGRQANSVIALLRLGDAETLWPQLESKPDSRLRSFLIDRLAQLGADPQVLVSRLMGEPNDSRRFAIIAALAQYRPEQLPSDQADRLRRFIVRWGTSDPAAAIHSVCEYLALRWQWDDVRIEIENAQTPDDDEQVEGPTWYRNGQGQTLAVVSGPVEFQMGSPGHEPFRDHSNETSKQMRIPRSFAISVAELTLDEYRRFDPDLGYAAEYTPTGQCPVNSISWYDAVRYCRWLSEQEDIEEDQMCYPRLENIGEGFEVPVDYLQRTGYRLPTEAEWEYACRAMTTTTRHFGYSNQLLMKYAWTVDNPLHQSKPQLHAVKQLLPNDFGLFDTLGNIMEWCQTRQGGGGETRRILIDGSDSLNPFDRGVLRGSAIFYPTTSTRSASREFGNPSYHFPYFGLRIARTMPAVENDSSSDE